MKKMFLFIEPVANVKVNFLVFFLIYFIISRFLMHMQLMHISVVLK